MYQPSGPAKVLISVESVSSFLWKDVHSMYTNSFHSAKFPSHKKKISQSRSLHGSLEHIYYLSVHVYGF